MEVITLDNMYSDNDTVCMHLYARVCVCVCVCVWC